MDYGLNIFATEYSMQPAQLAREAEARGFSSLWLPEHTHIPVSRLSPWPGGGELPRPYYDSYDPFVALAVAAEASEHIKLGLGVCLVVERDPIALAKAVASLDRLSGGRVLFGVGGGWNAEEMANHGSLFERRWKVLRERVEAMKLIWTEDEAEYHGEFVDFDPVFSWPKPLQQPHPPVYIGGEAPWALKRAVRYCDGWMPIGVRDEILAHIPAFRQAANDAGRDPDSLDVIVYFSADDEDTLKAYRDAGVSQVTFGLPSEGAEKVLPLLDRYAEAAARVG